MEANLGTIAIVGATFVLAGGVKGIIGLGLPTVTLAILTVAFDLTTAMAQLLVPSFLTNLYQGAVGGHAMALCRRLWPFLLLAVVTVSIGGAALGSVDVALLSMLLGVVLLAYSSLDLLGARLSVGAKQERWAGPLMGSVNGILTGMTGSFVVPGVLFLQAIGLPRDELVQAMGILFTLSTVALAVALQSNGLLSAELGVWSVAGVVPAILGMMLGARIRKGLSEQRFRRLFFISMWILGLYIVVGALAKLG